MGTLTHRFGDNLGILMLDICQDHIQQGDLDKAVNVYMGGLQGFKMEYLVMLLKNEAVLDVDKERGELVFNDWETSLKLNKKNIRNWDWWCGKQIGDMHERAISMRKN